MANLSGKSGLRVAVTALACGLAMPVMAAAPAAAPVEKIPAAPPVEKIKVHSVAIEGNLEGNSADRDVIVVLPPSYKANPKKRYPVIYFLHGYFAHADMYDGMVKFADAMAGEAARGHEFILVAPDSYTKFGGAMYSNSPTTGNFEGFVSKDLVAYVDSHYRTIARPDARGLSGHSMGGYGTLKIAMKYPGIFSSIYAMSPCCLSARTITPEAGKAMEALTPEQAEKGEFLTRAGFAAASAWSPAPDKPPFFFEIGTRDGVVQPDVLAEWAANAPIAMLPQYLSVLKGYKAIAMDVGDKDNLVGADDIKMHGVMERFGLKHQWQLYDGDHGNRVPQRFRENLLPFFAANLATK